MRPLRIDHVLLLLVLTMSACGVVRVDDPGASLPDAGSTPDTGFDAGGGGSPTGAACSGDDDCASRRCRTDLPGGYCTAPCSATGGTSPCGLATRCGDLGSPGGESFCEAACGTEVDCRGGYQCVSGGCVPAPSDAGFHDAGSDGGASDAGPCAGSRCGATCVDTSHDNANCGSCGHVCPELSICTDSRCADTWVNVGFSTTLTCNGSTTVYLGVRPPQTTNADVICWTPITANGSPVGDQLWTYDATNRVLVNQVNQLALKVRSDGSLTVGTSATDGTTVVPHAESGGLWSLAFTSRNTYVGISKDNCPGAPYREIAAGIDPSYRMAFTLH